MTSNVTIGPGAYLRIQPEEMAGRPRASTLPDDRRPPGSAFEAQPPPVMEAGSVVVLSKRACAVLWADGSRAVVSIEDRAWLMTHMTPAEMALHRDAYEVGSRVQEWIVRRPVEDFAEFDH